MPQAGQSNSDLTAWCRAEASRASVIIDAQTYFAVARQAMLEARSNIFMLGWDFDSRIVLDPEADDGAPRALGPFVSWLAKQRPDLRIYILRWDIGALKTLVRGTTLLRLMQWWASGQVHFRLDGAHPPSGSHHEKILVIDDQLAFCGGIDMTLGRWDTRRHADDEPGRRPPGGGPPTKPWHDATMALEGGAAAALGRLVRERWAAATGETLRSSDKGETSPWPENLAADFEATEVAFARTRGATEDRQEIREIEALHLEMIRSAKRFAYFESQYFASPALAQAIADRLAEPDGPEFVVVHPRSAEGWLQSEAMDSARAQLVQTLQDAPGAERLRLYCPCTEGEQEIYVHAKIGIIDDEILRVGSANMNNRSLSLDSESDAVIDARAGTAGDDDRRGRIRALRLSLLGEHLGVEPHVVAQNEREKGSLIAAIEGLRGQGRSLRPYTPPKDLGPLETLAAEADPLDPDGSLAATEPLTWGGFRHMLTSRLGWMGK